MKYATLGKTGLKVSVVGLGMGPSALGAKVREEQARALVDTAWEAGVNFFDTANTYSRGSSEEVLGKLLKSRRQQAIIATKVGMPTSENPNEVGLSRSHILGAVEDSLRRLQTDYIDLYYSHWPDYETHLEQILRTMDDLVRQGKVRYIGCSNHPAWYICKALWISDVRNLTSFVCVQPRYNLIDREAESELIPLCSEEKIGVAPYNPLAAGFLSGKYKRDQVPPKDSRFSKNESVRPMYWHESNFDLVEKLTQVAAEHGKTPAQLALAWLVNNPVVTAPMLGTSKVSQLEENLKAADMTLSTEERQICDGLRGVSQKPMWQYERGSPGRKS